MRTASELFDNSYFNLIQIKKLEKRLNQIEKELDKCRTSVIQDGWQTQRHAKKSRKWDFLAQEKIEILSKLEDLKS